MRNPFRVWREINAAETRLAERAADRIACDRFAASHQDPEVKRPDAGGRTVTTPFGPQLPTAADVQAAADEAALFTWMPDAVPAAGTQAALDRLAQTERAWHLQPNCGPEPEA